MSTTLTKEENLKAAKADVARITALIEAHERTAPVVPIKAATNSKEMKDYLTKNSEYKVILADLNTQLDTANRKVPLAEYNFTKPVPGAQAWKAQAWHAKEDDGCDKNNTSCTIAGGKKSRKSRKSKKSHTTYKKSKRSRR